MGRKHTQNKIVMYDDYAEIVITDRKGNEKARAKIDIDDVDRVKDYKWSLSGKGYVMNEYGATEGSERLSCCIFRN